MSATVSSELSQGWREKLRAAAEKRALVEAWEAAHPDVAEAWNEALREDGQREHDAQQLQAMDAFLDSCGVEERERDLVLAGLDGAWGRVQPEGAPLPYSAVEKAREWWRGPDTFLTFLGAAGTGKTVAAAELCSLCRFSYSREDLGDVWVWPSVNRDRPAFRLASKLAAMPHWGEDVLRERRFLSTCRLLVLDELGGEMMSDGWLSVLQEVINDRYRARRKTVLIANLARKDFARRYGDRITRRLSEAGVIVDMGDKRLSRREEVPRG